MSTELLSCPTRRRLPSERRHQRHPLGRCCRPGVIKLLLGVAHLIEKIGTARLSDIITAARSASAGPTSCQAKGLFVDRQRMLLKRLAMLTMVERCEY